MNTKIGTCKKSYEIKSRGIVIFFQHNLSGLRKGTILHSISSNIKWMVESRILFLHTAEIHKVFDNEFFTTAHASFKDDKARAKSQNKIEEEERQHIYQYMVKPISHNLMPGDEEQLVILNFH